MQMIQVRKVNQELWSAICRKRLSPYLPGTLCFPTGLISCSALLRSRFSLILNLRQLPSLSSLPFRPPSLLSIAGGLSSTALPLGLSWQERKVGLSILRVTSGSFLKNQCPKASLAVNLFDGSFSKSPFRRLSPKQHSLVHVGGSWLYSNFQKLILHCLLSSMMPSLVGALKGALPRIMRWKTTPRLNRSQAVEQAALVLRLAISGATYPGVPQRGNMSSFLAALSASPKSAITQSLVVSLKRMFSGLMSLCMQSRWCMACSPWRTPLMTALTSPAENLYLLLMRSWRLPPESSSRQMQMEFLDSQTSTSRIRFLWLTLRIIWIQFCNERAPFSYAYTLSLGKAFTAQCFPSSKLRTRCTKAKAPLPISRMCWKASWKPRWLSLSPNCLRHSPTPSPSCPAHLTSTWCSSLANLIPQTSYMLHLSLLLIFFLRSQKLSQKLKVSLKQTHYSPLYPPQKGKLCLKIIFYSYNWAIIWVSAFPRPPRVKGAERRGGQSGRSSDGISCTIYQSNIIWLQLIEE